MGSLAHILRAAARAAVAGAALLGCAAAASAQDDLVTPIQDIERLAEVIGGAHQLRQLCDKSDQVWRREMLSLIEIEAHNDKGRQRKLIDAFNRGFRVQEQRRRSCNADARRAEAQLAAEGRRLAEDLRDRYLN